MPKGMTPRKRMTRTVGSLAKSLKPSGRLNRDDIKKTKELRKKMSLSEIKDAKRLGRAAQLAKGATKAASLGVASNMKGIKELMKKISNAKERSKKTLAPVRSIRERAKQSRLVGGKSKLRKPKR